MKFCAGYFARPPVAALGARGALLAFWLRFTVSIPRLQ